MYNVFKGCVKMTLQNYTKVKEEWSEEKLTKWFANDRGIVHGHWEKYHELGRKTFSPYDVDYGLEARKWFIENNYLLIECKKCIQAD